MSCNENINMCVLKLSEVEDTITSSNKSIMVIHCEIVPFKLIKIIKPNYQMCVERQYL